MPDLIHNPTGRPLWLGYCTNVHPAETREGLFGALDTLWSTARARACPDHPMGVGLWLSAPLLAELDEGDALPQLAERLAEAGLHCRTLNAFPYGGFHADKVKRDVYRPSWAAEDRLAYTIAAARALARLLPGAADRGTISTVPLGWPSDIRTSEAAIATGINVLRAAEALEALEDETGRRIQLLLEPEPGCALETTDQAIAFYHALLSHPASNAAVRARIKRYLGICFDCCHQAVMGEDLAEAISLLAAADVPVGKLHLSSAPVGPLGSLAPFAEGRYLHQTLAVDGSFRFDDLPEALADPARHAAHVRTHFHVPVFETELPGGLTTTAAQLPAALEAALSLAELPHFEIETYTWHVLPGPPQTPAEGIAKEITFTLNLLARYGATLRPSPTLETS
ncbi:MAG: metabolite traffic protein EboE [Planctomycetota bacterium]|jgi:sugar phosphate isomerase/epimerase